MALRSCVVRSTRYRPALNRSPALATAGRCAVLCATCRGSPLRRALVASATMGPKDTLTACYRGREDTGEIRVEDRLACGRAEARDPKGAPMANSVGYHEP